MNEKEIGEIRRRLRPEKNSISHICGCYVNEKREIVSLFDQPVLRMPAEEAESYLTLFKRSLSGTVGKNLIDVEFATRQVAEGGEHKLLMALRDSDLRDVDAVKAFCGQVIQNLTIEGGYVILLAHDTYDVPYRAKDGERMDDASSEVYSYLMCSICPVKGVKPALSYDFADSIFHSRDGGWVISAPELGFLFPAFDGRSANLYNALYYCHDISENHREFADAVFHAEIPMMSQLRLNSSAASVNTPWSMLSLIGNPCSTRRAAVCGRCSPSLAGIRQGAPVGRYRLRPHSASSKEARGILSRGTGSSA